MEFKPEQPKKPSDAELIEERTSKLLSELRELGREVKDFFDKRRAVEAMIRKRLEGGLDEPPKKEEAKKPSLEAAPEKPKKGEVEIAESELEAKIKGMLDRALETRNFIEKSGLSSEKVDKIIKDLEELRRRAKLSSFLDSITEEVEKRKGN